MNDLLAAAMRSWPTIALIGGAIVAIVGAVAGYGPGLLDLWGRLADRLYVRQIVDGTDADLVALDELQANAFDDAVGDDMGEVQRHLEESQRGRAVPQDSRPFVLVFVLKLKRTVCGYLSAEYFPRTRTIFLWYLLVDHQKVPVAKVYQRGARMLLERLVRAADATGVRWQHIITEVEAAPSDLLRARAKLQLFRNAAAVLSRKAKRDTVHVFRLPIDYRQPVLRTEFLADAAAHEVPEWLLYAPRQLGGGVAARGRHYVMTQATARQLLETLLIESYGETFPESEAYRTYCRAKFEACVKALPAELVLVERPGTM